MKHYIKYRYAIIYLLNGKQHVFCDRLEFTSQRNAVAFFWGYNHEFRGRARVIATLRFSQ
jgi:hypothetical protein